MQVVRDFRRPEARTEAEVDANGDGELLVVLDLRPDTDLQVSGTAWADSRRHPLRNSHGIVVDSKISSQTSTVSVFPELGRKSIAYSAAAP